MSLLAAAWLLTACLGPSADPADDSASDEAPADGSPVDDSEVDGPVDADARTATGDAGDPGDTGADPGDVHGPLPRFLAADTPDGRYTMTVDRSATLELPKGTTSPTVDGTAVEVFDVASFADSGVAQWEIRAIEPGESTITVTADGHERVWTIIVED